MIEDSAIVSAEFLAKEATPDYLVKKASKVMRAATAATVDHDELKGYVDTLKQDKENGIDSLSITIELIGKAATKLEQLATYEVNSLRMPAVSLVCECQKFQRGSNAMAAVQNAAVKLQREQAQGRWWRLWGRRRLRGLEEGGAPGDLPSAQVCNTFFCLVGIDIGGRFGAHVYLLDWRTITHAGTCGVRLCAHRAWWTC